MKKVETSILFLFAALSLFAQKDSTLHKGEKWKIGLSSTYFITPSSVAFPPIGFFLIPEISMGEKHVIKIGILTVPQYSSFGLGGQIGYEHFFSTPEGKLSPFFNTGLHYAYDEYREEFNTLYLQNGQVSPAVIIEKKSQFGFAFGWGCSFRCTKRILLYQNLDLACRINAKFAKLDVLNYPEYSYALGTSNILKPTSMWEWLPMIKAGILYIL